MFSKTTPRAKGVSGVYRTANGVVQFGPPYADPTPDFNILNCPVLSVTGRNSQGRLAIFDSGGSFGSYLVYRANNADVGYWGSGNRVFAGAVADFAITAIAAGSLLLGANSTQFLKCTSNGNWTMAHPTATLTGPTFTINGNDSAGGFPALQVNGSSTAAAGLFASGATGTNPAFQVTNGIANTYLQLNGDGSFQLGFNGTSFGIINSDTSGNINFMTTGNSHNLDCSSTGQITLLSASNATPPTGQINGNGYQVKGFPEGAHSVSASAAINTTETYVTPSYAGQSAGTVAGQAWKITLYGTCTSTVANVSTFTPRWGTAGTTADTALTTLTCTAAASGTTIPFIIEIWVICRTSTTAWTYARLINQGVTGISATQIVLNTGASTTISTAGAIHIGCSYKSAATTTTTTFQSTNVERLF